MRGFWRKKGGHSAPGAQAHPALDGADRGVGLPGDAGGGPRPNDWARAEAEWAQADQLLFLGAGAWAVAAEARLEDRDWLQIATFLAQPGAARTAGVEGPIDYLDRERLDTAVDQVMAAFGSGLLGSPSRLTNPLLDLWALVRSAGDGVVRPLEALLSSLPRRGAVARDEVETLCSDLRAALSTSTGSAVR